MQKKNFLILVLCFLFSSNFFSCITDEQRDNPFDAKAKTVFQKKGSLKGKIVLQDQLPPLGTTVRLTSTLETKEVTTDTQGEFHITGLTPDKYTVTVSREGYREHTEQVEIEIDRLMNIGERVLQNKIGSSRGFVFLFDENGLSEVDRQGARVTFIRQVTGSSAQALTVGKLQADDEQGGSGCVPAAIDLTRRSYSAISNPDGSFYLSGIPAGDYQVQTSKNNYAPDQGNNKTVTVQEEKTSTMSDLKLRKVTGVVEVKLRQEDKSLKLVEYTKESQVVLSLYAFGEAVDRMLVREDEIKEDEVIPEKEWLEYKAEHEFTLSEGDGKKLIYVKFRDRYCQESKVYIGVVTLDQTVPQIEKLSVAEDKEAVNDSPVGLLLDSSDNLTAIHLLWLSEKDLADEEVLKDVQSRPYIDSVAYFLQQDATSAKVVDEPKTVYARVSDLAGNISETVKVEFEYDSQAPVIKTGFPRLAQGSSAVNVLDIDVELGVEKASHYDLLNGLKDCSHAKYRPIEPKVRFLLEAGDGDKNVTLCAIDKASNVATASSSIKLDTVPPQPSATDAILLADTQGTPRPVKVVKDRDIFFKLNASGADGYELAEGAPNFSASNPSGYQKGNYQSLVAFQLSEGEGIKTVFCRFFDQAGNISNVHRETLYYAQKVPRTEMVLDGGSAYTGDPRGQVEVRIFVQDMEGLAAAELRYSEDAQELLKQEFQSFVSVFNYIFKEPQGPKNLYAQIKDTAGNVSKIFSAGIIWDAQILAGTCQINQGTGYTNKRQVKVKILSKENDLQRVRLSSRLPMGGAAWLDFDPANPEVDFQLPAGDGQKSVYISFEDMAGNRLDRGAECAITLDTKPPFSVSVVINGGQARTASRDVRLYLRASDDRGLKRFYLSNQPDFKEQKEINSLGQHNWKLAEGGGVKTVYFKALDLAGNQTVTQDSIEFDSGFKPEGNVTVQDGEYIQKPLITLVMGLPTAATEMEISGDLEGGKVLREAAAVKRVVELSRSEGEKWINVTFYNSAGKILTSLEAATFLDLHPPVLQSLLLEG